MMYTFFKIIMTAIVIGAITEIARRFPVYGGMLAALPLISIISLIWLTVQGQSMENVQKFTYGVLVGLPATAVMLFVMYMALKQSVHLAIALFLGIGAWGLCFMGQKYLFAALEIMK